MDYEKARRKLFRSPQMSVMNETVPPVKGYASYGIYADLFSRQSDFIALIYGLDADYSCFLALAECIYRFDSAKSAEKVSAESVAEFLKSILGEPAEEKAVSDLIYLLTKAGDKTPEATAVERTEEIILLFNRMSKEEREKNGGPLLESTFKRSLKKNAEGYLEQSELYYKFLESIE